MAGLQQASGRKMIPSHVAELAVLARMAEGLESATGDAVAATAGRSSSGRGRLADARTAQTLVVMLKMHRRGSSLVVGIAVGEHHGEQFI